MLLLGRAGSAQETISDSSFVQLFPDTLNLRLIWVNRGFDLRVRHAQQSGTLLHLPRYRPRVGFGGFLWNVGFNLLLPLRLPQDSDNRTFRRFDFQGSVFARRWLVDGAFHRYRGFNVHLVGALDADLPTIDEDPLFREQLITKKVQLSVAYLPGGNRISLRSPYNQGDRQQKSTGSLILSGAGTFFSVRDPEDVISWRPPDLNESPLTRVKVYALSSKLGYVANLVYRSWFVHLFLTTGLDWQQTYYRQARRENTFSVEPTYDARSGLGYDSGRFYGGLYGSLDYHQFNAGDWQFQGTSGQLRLFFGIRFTEPGWLHRRKPKFLEDLQNSPSIPLPPIFG